MKQYLQLLIDALKLSRVNNLVIVLLTQYCVALFLILGTQRYHELITDVRFFVMAISTLIIAASGYYINDYYDIKIDLINKPEKVIVGTKIKRRQVMIAHVAFNAIGILLGAWVSPWIGLINFVAVFILWFYSNTLKRMPFVGNLAVAILTGTTIAMLNIYFKSNSLLVYTYAFFAFGINLIRELIKDVEDMQGDATFGSRSLPVLFGIRRTKWLLYLLIVGFLAALMIFLGAVRNQILTYYFMALGVPFAYFIYCLIKADSKKHFTFLSKYCKWLILVGILSIGIIKF